MKTTLLASAFTGLAWSLLAVLLMGGTQSDWFRASFLLGGIAAGIAAGFQTARSREKRIGKESIISGLVCYYLAILVFWATWIIVERILMCVDAGGWTDFDLRDHLNMLLIYLIYGTTPPYGLILIPLCFLNRLFIWRIYLGNQPKPNQPLLDNA